MHNDGPETHQQHANEGAEVSVANILVSISQGGLEQLQTTDVPRPELVYYGTTEEAPQSTVVSKRGIDEITGRMATLRGSRGMLHF